MSFASPDRKAWTARWRGICKTEQHPPATTDLLYFSRLLTTRQHRLLSLLFAPLTLLSSSSCSSCWRSQFHVNNEIKKKIPKGGANGQDSPGAKLSFDQKGPHRLEERRVRGESWGLRQGLGRLWVALRAKGRAEQGKAGWYFASTFSFRRVLWIQMHPLCLALLAMVALQQRFPLLPASALETRPRGCPWAPSKATLFPHRHQGLLCAGRPQSDPGLCRPTRADTARAQCRAPADSSPPSRASAWAQPPAKPAMRRLVTQSTSSTPPSASKSLQEAKMCQK